MTDDRQTTTYSERELEFTFAKKTCAKNKPKATCPRSFVRTAYMCVLCTNQCTKPQYKNTAPNSSDNLPSYNNNCTKMKITVSIINHIIATLLYVCCTVYNLQQQINHS